jgi:hypothetical protein
MPKPVTVSFDVSQDREYVFEFLDLMANHEQFNDHLMRNWRLSGRPRWVGSIATVDVRALGMSDTVEIEVTEAEPSARIVERNTARKAGRIGEGTYALKSLPSGTQITFEYKWLRAPLVDRLAAPLVRSYIRRNNTIAMRRLADQLSAIASGPRTGDRAARGDALKG